MTLKAGSQTVFQAVVFEDPVGMAFRTTLNYVTGGFAPVRSLTLKTHLDEWPAWRYAAQKHPHWNARFWKRWT